MAKSKKKKRTRGEEEIGRWLKFIGDYQDGKSDELADELDAMRAFVEMIESDAEAADLSVLAGVVDSLILCVAAHLILLSQPKETD